MKLCQHILCLQRAVSFYKIKPKNKESRRREDESLLTCIFQLFITYALCSKASIFSFTPLFVLLHKLKAYQSNA